MPASANRPRAQSTYQGILRATSLIGGASALNVLVGMVRTKVVAVLLGPAGVGLLAVYGQIVTLASTVAGMGIATSGVRQVAEAMGTGDEVLIARTVVTLRRTAWMTGLLGMAGLAALAIPVSRLTFASSDHAVAVGLLGLPVLFGSISAGQTCLLRGARRIADIARLTVVGALASTAVTLPCLYFWAFDGILPALVLGALASLGVSWLYARRIPVQATAMSWFDSWLVARDLLTLGLSLMVSGLVSTGATYFIQVLLVRRFGIDDAGLYQAAFSLSGALIGFVLGAMSADYYPRLTGAAGDGAAVRRMVNEQTQVSILLALPALAAMLVFSPLVVRLFFDRGFEAAVPILRWCVLGMLGRVLSWPLGFVLLARGRGRLFLATESAAAGVHVVAVLGLSAMWGPEGAGLAFMALYVCYTVLMLLVMHSEVGGAWTGRTSRLAAGAAASLGMLQAARLGGTPEWLRLVFDVSILGAGSAFCAWCLYRRFHAD